MMSSQTNKNQNQTSTVADFAFTLDEEYCLTCIGTFVFSSEVRDFVPFVNDIKTYDFCGGDSYDFSPILFQPTDHKMFSFLTEIFWDNMADGAMYHLPYRFRGMLSNLNLQSEALIIERLLMLSGDIETNPGPVQSRPLLYCNNDPKYIKLEKALERRDDKIKTLLKKLRYEIKTKRIYAQGIWNVPENAINELKNLNGNMERVYSFLENTLPSLQANVIATVLKVNDDHTQIKEDLMKIAILLLIVKLLMTWSKYKTALVVVLLFIAKFYKLDKYIIDLIGELKTLITTNVPQTQGIAEDIIYHPYFAVCGKIIFAALSFICIKQIPGKRDWDNYITRIDRIPKAIEGGRKIIDYCAEYFNVANDQLKMLVLGKTKEELSAHSLHSEIYEWAKEVRHYVDLDERNKIDTDITVANKVENLYKQGIKYQQDNLIYASDKDLARLISVTLLLARQLYEYVSQSPVKGGGPRMKPVCIWLGGQSGVGKTEMVYPLCIDLLRTMGLMKKEDFHHQVYGRQVETEYWDGYKGQKIVIYDDAFQKKDDKTTPNPEIFEVIRSCNTFPQHLHMAALSDKNTFAQAEVYLYTTNDMTVSIESLTWKDAFFQRMAQNAYQVQPKEEFAITIDGKRRLDQTKLAGDIIDLSIYEFQKMTYNANDIAQPWTPVGEPIDYATFCERMCGAWKKAKTEAKKKLQWLSNYAVRAQVFPETDNEEFFECDFNSELYTRMVINGEALVDIEADYALDEEKFSKYLDFKNKNVHKPSISRKYYNIAGDLLSRVSSKLTQMALEIKRIISDHPYLSILGFIGVFLSAFTIYQSFTSLMSNEEDENEDPNTFNQRLICKELTKLKSKSPATQEEDFEQMLENIEKNRKPLPEVGSSGGAKMTNEEDENEDPNTFNQRLICKELAKLKSKNPATQEEDFKQMLKNIEKNRKPLPEVGSSGDAKTKQMKRTVVEVGVSGDSKTAKTKKTVVEAGEPMQFQHKDKIDRDLLDVVNSQGVSDEVAHNLVTDRLRKNTYRLSYERNNKIYQLGNCTFIRGWIFVMPYHFLQACYARKLSPQSVISFSQPGQANIIQIPLSHLIIGNEEGGFDLSKNCVRISFTNGDQRDCVLTNLHKNICHPHRDLLKHFVRKSDQGALVGKFSGTIATYHHDGNDLCRAYQWLMGIRPMDKEISIYHPEDGNDYGEDFYVQRDCYEYNAPTQVGDCGSLIGLYNHRLERKIIGMHIAGNENEEHGYACPLTQEVLESACNTLIRRDISNISTHCFYEAPDIVNTMHEPILPEGKFCAIGKSSVRVGQATKSTLVKSKLYGKLHPPTMAPAPLKPFMKDGIIIDPLMNGLKKCGVETAILSHEQIFAAASDVSQTIMTQFNTLLDRSKYQRILTYEQAIRGTQDDAFMCAMNRTTSPGFPYNMEKRDSAGKMKWMGQGENFDFTSTDSLKLRADVERLINNCREGRITDVFCVDTLKDERRAFEKVSVGKTRVFSACPQHFVIAFRKYFLPFSAWLMHNRIDNEIAVGTNVYSTDWERIHKKLQRKGDKVIAGDFGNFDGSLNAQILWAIFWDIFVPWLKTFIDVETEEGKDNLKICLGLWTHLVHSVHIFGDNVYMWTHSQPSGNPFTVIINCLYNSIIMRISWMRVMEQFDPTKISMKFFRKYVSMVSYGDDNVLNISDAVIKYYNQTNISNVMADMKHEYTDEAKTGTIVDFRKLDEVFFLKRSFRFCPELQRHVAPLKEEVIYEMLNWSRNTIDPDEILMSNIETAFREIVYHGREKYDKLRKDIEAVQFELPMIPQILPYEVYLHDIKNLADELYEF
nr:MAG: putative replicase polyprotein [Dicistroviridae sp.]